MPETPPSDLLTLVEAAKVVNRSTVTLRRWIRSGDLPGTVRVKQRLLVPRAALLAMYKPVETEAA